MASFSTRDLLKAKISLEQFRTFSASPYHERYIFPFLRGTYFAYRKIDVLRLISIAKAISNEPTYLDVGCGYGDFLNKISEFIQNATGIEKDFRIFYIFNIPIPNYIKIADAHWGIDQKHDIIFVGWMDPAVDFRDAIAAKTEVIVTTLDQGISLAAEFDAHGFEMIASWRTPSWEDVNIELMNRYYTKMSDTTRQFLSNMRGAHNLWYVYSNKPNLSDAIKSALRRVEQEKKSLEEHYDFENVLDDCGFRYLERLECLASEEPLWRIRFFH